jgi:hypothetical protein
VLNATNKARRRFPTELKKWVPLIVSIVLIVTQFEIISYSILKSNFISIMNSLKILHQQGGVTNDGGGGFFFFSLYFFY